MHDSEHEPLTKTWIDILTEPLQVAKVHSFLNQSEGGGVCVFAGTTRRVTGNRRTAYLSYEAHTSMALKEMGVLVERAQHIWPLLRVVILHRVGVVPVGEESVLIGVATAHRGPSFEATQFLIDELKKSVQIWKKEHFEDETTEWVGTQWTEEVNTGETSPKT